MISLIQKLTNKPSQSTQSQMLPSIRKNQLQEKMGAQENVKAKEMENEQFFGNDFNLLKDDEDDIFNQNKENVPPSKNTTATTVNTTPMMKQSKKITKKKVKPLSIRAPWTEKHQIVQINRPELNNNSKSKRKYKIRFQYKDHLGQIHNTTVRFGDKNGGDYIDHHNNDKRSTILLRMRKYDCPFNPNYWRIHLLNTADSIQEGWNNYISEHNCLKM